jgi:enoyl-CoA hydratase/carnithine racemase
MIGLSPGQVGDTVVTELAEGVLTVSLNRPDAAHARNQVMRDELASLWTAVGRDRSIRAVVVTGTGDRFFCAGMDLKEAGQDEDAITRRDRMQRSRDIEQLAALPQPTIAAINGYALGGGLETALACDIRIAAAGAQVGLPEITRGLVPGGGGTQRLPGLVGYSRAFELVVSGRRMTADEAYDWGLVSRVVEPAELLTAALDLAHSFAQNSEPAVRYAKTLLRASLEVPVHVGVQSELDSVLTLMAGANRRAFNVGVDS